MICHPIKVQNISIVTYIVMKAQYESVVNDIVDIW